MQPQHPLDEMTRILNNVRGIAGTMFELGDLKKNQQLNEAAYILEAYLNVLRAFDAATKLHPLDTAERFDLASQYVGSYMREALMRHVKNKDANIDDLRAIADFYHREAEKNLRLLNEARGVIWHSVEEELPSENGTYLVVGKSGTVCTAHFYTEHTSYESGIKYHAKFSNRYVRFWAKLPEPPVPNQDYQHTDNK